MKILNQAYFSSDFSWCEAAPIDSAICQSQHDNTKRLIFSRYHVYHHYYFCLVCEHLLISTTITEVEEDVTHCLKYWSDDGARGKVRWYSSLDQSGWPTDGPSKKFCSHWGMKTFEKTHKNAIIVMFLFFLGQYGLRLTTDVIISHAFIQRWTK